LNLNKNVDISIFLKNDGKDISLQISLKFAFKYRETNIFRKMLNFMVNGITNTVSGVFLVTKSLQQHF